MAIGKVDKEETAKLEKKIEKKKEFERNFGHASLSLEESVAGPSGLGSGNMKNFEENDNSRNSGSSSDDSIRSDSNDQDFMWSYPIEKRPKLAKKTMKRLSLNRTAKAVPTEASSNVCGEKSRDGYNVPKLTQGEIYQNSIIKTNTSLQEFSKLQCCSIEGGRVGVTRGAATSSWWVLG